MSEERFLECVTRMRSKLYHAAIAILWDEQDAADAVQEAMLKGWKHRGGLRDEALFEVWFMRILVNQCRDLQRRQIRRRRLMERAAQQVALEDREAPNAALMEAVCRLPDRERLPVLLYYFDGYSQAEVGRIVGATAEQVKARIRAGRVKLKKLLSEGDEGIE